MIAAVLFVSEQLHVHSVPFFSASQTSNANLKKYIYKSLPHQYKRILLYTQITGLLFAPTQKIATHTSRESDELAVSCSSYITSSDCDSVDSGALQLVYGVAI